MNNKGFSNGCENCPDMWACSFAKSYLPISNNLYHDETKKKPITAFFLKRLGCHSIQIPRTVNCANKCEDCPKVKDCVLEDHAKSKDNDRGFVGDNAPFLCSGKIQELYNPDDYAHQRIIFYYKERAHYDAADKKNLLSFAEKLPKVALMDYAVDKNDNTVKLAEAISEHVKNKLIPLKNDLICFVKKCNKEQSK